MIVVISGTNRPASNTRRVAGLVTAMLTDHGRAVSLVDLQQLPDELFSPSAYADKPAGFARFQDTVLAAHGILTVVPEYNGSFPGVLKYFIDMLRFPESLLGQPAAFVGLSNGRWGALRAVEQLGLVFQYRQAHLFGRRVFLPDIGRKLDAAGQLVDTDSAARLEAMVVGFADFCDRLGTPTPLR